VGAGPIDVTLAEFLQSGIPMLVGTRDRFLVPAAARGFGLRVEPGGEEAVVFVPRAWGAAAIENLRDNGRIAVSVARVADHRSVQIKGRVVEIRDSDDADRSFVEAYRDRLVPELGSIGYPPKVLHRMLGWPSHAVRFRVESLFEQTPGPGAGKALRDETNR
jgi:hypothetical protein